MFREARPALRLMQTEPVPEGVDWAEGNHRQRLHRQITIPIHQL